MKPSKEERKLITDFYMWMVENDYDHNIRIRVENKAELFLRERGQVKNTVVVAPVSLDEQSEATVDCATCKYMSQPISIKACWSCSKFDKWEQATGN